MHKVWNDMKGIMNYDGISEYMPLWDNLRLEELGKLEGFNFLYERGIKFVVQLYHQTVLRSYQDM